MVSIEVLSVGKELLIGRTANTNAYWIGGRLARMGAMIDRIVTITDSLNEISSALVEMLERKPDFVLVLGGLGPTPDDMTLEGVARGLKRKLEVNAEAIRMIREHYRKTWNREFELTPSRKKMATLPKGALSLPNALGTAPGVRLSEDGTVIVCLPGVPREMKSIFRSSVEKEIKEKIGKLYTRTVTLNLEKIFESTLAPILKGAMKMYPRVYIKSHPKGVREGVSRIELDIVVSSKKWDEVNRSSEKIASYLSRKITASGGSVVGRKEHG